MFFVSCKEQKVYECSGWEKRNCLCPNGESGNQKCSRGPAFADPPPVREWLPCSCCFYVEKDQYGYNYINYNDASGCWDDVYDPSISTIHDVAEDDN